jgi:hypothetical protein
VPQGSLSPRQYAPHIYDPDPNPEPMSDAEIAAFGKKVGEFMRAKGIKTK